MSVQNSQSIASFECILMLQNTCSIARLEHGLSVQNTWSIVRFECGLKLAEQELNCIPWYLPQVLVTKSIEIFFY